VFVFSKSADKDPSLLPVLDARVLTNP